MPEFLQSRSRERRGERRGRLAAAACVVALGILGISGGRAKAAEIRLYSDFGSGLLVNDSISVDLRISHAEEFPVGRVDVTLSWGGERIHPNWIGALQLLELPSAVDPGIELSLEPDCGDSLSMSVGSCRLSIDFLAPRPAGVVTVATLGFLYTWELAPGWEFCGPGTDPTCVVAGQRVGLATSDLVAFGETTGLFPSYLEFTTLSGVGVRPIPEPGAALLIGLGLAVLARSGCPTRQST